jgi:Protein kinase domain/Protein of unknown function (DUF1559)
MNSRSVNHSVDESCRRKLEASWTSNPPPLAIEECLPPADSQSFVGTLLELACCELEFRLRRANPADIPRIEEYLQRFEQLRTPEIEWELLSHELEVRRSLGDPPSMSELTNRFPHWSNRLSQLQLDTHSRNSTDTWNRTDDATQPFVMEQKPVQTTGNPTEWSSGSFGDFELVRRIAAGGMGVVFLARHKKLDRLVALKFLRAGQLADELEVKRFLREAENSAQLSHPNIVPIYDVGELGGHPYFSMAYIEGESLQARLSQGSMSDRQAAQMLLTIAQAVGHAHDLGIIHRDLKPANVLLDKQSAPYVTDFGLARRMSALSSLTETGQIMGTPVYMAPEQARGDNDNVGKHSDQYSLGAILYEMLTGHRPFEGPAHIVVMKVISSDPLLPREINPGVSRDLEAICLKAMQKNSVARYADVRDMADDLQRFLAGESITARRYGMRERYLRKLRRHRAWIVSAVGILLTVMLTWWLASKPNTTPNKTATNLDRQAAFGLASRVQKSSQNLRSIGTALHNYHNVYNRLPVWAISNKEGQPLLSWRVAILKYLGEDALFQKFRLDEPWDSPHNSQLLQYMPDTYNIEGTESPKYSTFYRALVNTGSCFEPDFRSVGLRDIKDGPHNTMMLAEAKTAVPWTKPDEITLNSDQEYSDLGGTFEEGFHALMGDGDVRFFRTPILKDLKALKALVGRADGDLVNLNPYKGFPIPAQLATNNGSADSKKSSESTSPPKPTDDAQAIAAKSFERLQAADKKKRLFSVSANRLRELQRAIIDYESANRRLPLSAIYSTDGKPLLSWRVAVLKHLKEDSLFAKFHLDEPWDSPHNIQLLSNMPEVFGGDSDGKIESFTTFYQLLTGSSTPFPLDPRVTVRSSNVIDGLARTLGVVEAGIAVPWTKPEDVLVPDSGAMPKLGGLFEEGFQGAFLDGSTRSFVRTIDSDHDTLRAMAGHRDRMLFRFAPHRREFSLLPGVELKPDPSIAGAIQSAREAVLRTRSRNNLRTIASALQNHHDGFNTYPPPAICDAQGKPLLSWRVQLLPYLQERTLYDAFRLDEPWDSEHNSSLLKYMPETYQAPSYDYGEEVTTHYQAISGPGTFFDWDRKRFGKLAGPKLKDLRDGANDIVWLVESASPVPWTKPEDVDYSASGPFPELGGIFTEGFHAATVAGTVYFYVLTPENVADFRGLFQIDDGRKIDIKKLLGN